MQTEQKANQQFAQITNNLVLLTFNFDKRPIHD